MKIFYHADYDGVCAGAIAYRHFNKEAKMFPINYHIPFPFETIEKDEEVWLLDYGIPVEEMQRLSKITKNIGWIDHHKTSMGGGYPKTEGILSVDKSGCELTWDYFHKESPTPWAVKYIGDRDIWKWQYGDGTRFFYNGLQLEKDSMEPTASIWDTLLAMPENHKHVDRISERGTVVEKFKLIQNKDLVDRWAYEIVFEGYKCLVLNCSNTIDRLSNEMRERGHQISILYTFDGQNYTVSLYTADKDIDVSVIAKKYGGGGHKGASGFVTKELPFGNNKVVAHQ